MPEQTELHCPHRRIDTVEGPLDIDDATVARKTRGRIGQRQKDIGTGLMHLGAYPLASLAKRSEVDARPFGCSSHE